MAWQRTRIRLDGKYSKVDREAIAKEVIDHIIERSKGGRGINPETRRNKKFVRYSKEYAEAKGVSRSSVDLTASDEMLRAMELLSHNRESILIGYQNGSTWNERAEGNQTGSYGEPFSVPSRARPFLGISKGDLKRILDKYDEVD